MVRTSVALRVTLVTLFLNYSCALSECAHRLKKVNISISLPLVFFLSQLFAWGYNGNGQLGVGNNANQLTPCKVIGLVGTVTTQVSNRLGLLW